MQVATQRVGRGYSTQFEDHQALLHKFARRGFARLQSARINDVDYDEVFGQMTLYFVQAQQKYNAALGWTFAAYLGRVCHNNFQKWAETLTVEKMALGLISVEDMVGGEDDETSVADFYEFHQDDAEESAEEALDRKRRKGLYHLLSQDSRAVVTALIKADGNPSINTVGRELGFTATKMKRIKAELTRFYGIEL
jgi:hypothetical protein